MTKVPFSVEWLSQSSQKPPRLGPEGSEAHPAGGSRGPRVLEGDRFSGAPDRLESEGPSTSFRQSEPPATQPRAPREEAPPGGSSGPRRLRTAFTTKQISTLESSFKRHHYLGAAERRKLAGKMQLSEVQIKTWFQNRRMKLKRQLQDLRPPDPPPGFPLQLYSPLVLRSAPGPPPGLPSSYPGPAPFRVPGLIQECFAGGLTYPALPPPPFSPISCKAAPPAIPSRLAYLLNLYPEQASVLRTM